jgi:DUF4097 and DUF4098 domain-containing protein YvlB
MKIVQSHRLGMTAFLVFCMLPLAAVPVHASAEGSFQRTLQVSGPVNLDISTGSGNIQVRTGNTGQVQVSGHIKVNNWFGSDGEDRVKRIESNPPIQQSGNDIRIGHIEDESLRHNVSISYELVVPPDTQLRSHTGSGDQTVQGLHGRTEVESGSGNLRVSDIGAELRTDTGSGDVQIDRVNGGVQARAGSGDIHATGVAGAFEGHTGSGHIRVEQTAPGSVRAETGSGGIEMRGLHGSLQASAGSGDIDIDGEPTGSWTVHTGSGTVRLKVGSSTAFDLDAHTSSGSIHVSQPVTMQGSIDRKEIRGKVNGGGVSVRVETESGNIEIE